MWKTKKCGLALQWDDTFALRLFSCCVALPKSAAFSPCNNSPGVRPDAFEAPTMFQNMQARILNGRVAINMYMWYETRFSRLGSCGINDATIFDVQGSPSLMTILLDAAVVPSVGSVVSIATAYRCNGKCFFNILLTVLASNLIPIFLPINSRRLHGKGRYGPLVSHFQKDSTATPAACTILERLCEDWSRTSQGPRADNTITAEPEMMNPAQRFFCRVNNTP